MKMFAFFAIVHIIFAECAFACVPDANGKVDFSRGRFIYHEITNTTLDDCKPLVTNITELDLSDNSIVSIGKNAFNMFYNLEILNLSSNNINTLDVSSFTGLRRLRELYLGFNKLTKLQAGLIDIVTLQSVWFNNNNISEVEPGIVGKTNEALVFFNMNYNSLTKLDPWPYMTHQTNNRAIDRLFNIQHNKITAVTNDMKWIHNLTYPYEVEVNVMYNQIETFSIETIRQIKPDITDKAMFPVMLTLYMNITHNTFFCDCKLYTFANAVRSGVFRYLRIEEFRYRCSTPVHLDGWDFLHDLNLNELVCNHTDDCPAGCFCQERPHNDTLYVSCIGQQLTSMPDKLPATNRSKIELFLDNNKITEFKNTSYHHLIYNISMRNNAIKNLDAKVLRDLEAKHVDLSNNKIKTLPVEVKKFDTIKLRGNPLECGCDSMWMNEWLNIDTNNANSGLTCTSDKGSHQIRDMTLKGLGCTNELVVILCVCFGVLLALIITGLIFAKRCPYETKVFMHRIFKLHPADKYEVDDDETKDVDIYLIFDENDNEVRGYIRYFLHKLNKKRPFYNVLNPAAFMEPGSAADNIFKYLSKSKRVICFLSEGIFKNDSRIEEINDAERRQVEAVTYHGKSRESPDIESGRQSRASINSIGPIEFNTEYNTREVWRETDGIDVAPKIIYVIYNKDEALQKYLHQEPWKTRLAGKRVLYPDPDDKWFWSKLRYELPPTGSGDGQSTYMPFKREPLPGEAVEPERGYNRERSNEKPSTPPNPKKNKRENKMQKNININLGASLGAESSPADILNCLSNTLQLPHSVTIFEPQNTDGKSAKSLRAYPLLKSEASFNSYVPTTYKGRPKHS